MSAKFKGERQWVQEVLSKFEELTKLQPKPFDEDPKWPEWVSNLLVILTAISHPGLKVKGARRWKAKDLGRFVGRQYAIERVMAGEVPLSPQVKQGEKRFAAWAKKFAKERCPDFNQDVAKVRYEADYKVWSPQFRRAIEETLSSACGRRYRESSAFLEAFGTATVIKPDELLTERAMGVGDKICAVMFMLWRDIDRLHSVAELHRILEQALKPRGIVVKFKRIEKLCQRIKLKFKNPGRPPGGKIQTNPIPA